MAQLDPNIILSGRPAQLPSTEDLLRLRDLGQQGQIRAMQLDDARRSRQGQQTLADLYRTNTRPDGTVDTAAITRGMAGAGYGEQVPGLVKQGREAQKADLDSQAAQVDLHLKKLGVVNNALGALLSRPQVTHDDVITVISGLVDQGVIDNNQGAQMVRTLPGPDRLRQFLVEKAMETMTAAQQLEATRPKYDEQDRGGTISQGTIDPMTGQRTEGASITKTVSPDAAAQAAATAAAQGVTYQVDANGNLVAAPTKVVPGSTVRTQPVVGPDGQPLRSNKPTLNDTQAKALLFGSRMRAANKVMDAMSQAGTDIPSVTKSIVEGVPLVGDALGAAANMAVATPQQQQLEQAQRDFVNAVLRRESGAAISPSEFSSAKKQYFPQVGDSPEIKAQKKANRELAIRGLLQEVPEGQRNAIDAPDVPPSIARPAPAAGALPQVKSDADYNALPSGTQFIAPDGSHRVKP